MAEATAISVLEEARAIAARCYGCKKCSAGCPVAPWADLAPHVFVRLAQESDEEQLGRLLASETLWFCASCQTCQARCPHGVDLPHLADLLRREALARGVAPALPKVAAFHRTFLERIRAKGRIHELDLVGRYRLAAGGLFEDLGLGWMMFRKGKLRLLPPASPGREARREVRDIFRRRERSS